MNITKKQNRKGFTIVELIVVVVIIGILAAITIVSYNGIQAKARDASVLSDIDAMDALQTNYSLKNGLPGKAYYSGSGSDETLGFTPSSGNIIDVVVNGTDYCIRGYSVNGTKNTIYNALTKESSAGACNLLSPSSEAIINSPGYDADWIPGRSDSVMAGKYIYKTDLPSMYSWGPSPGDCVAPQCATGLDPYDSAKYTLVSPQANPAVDFSAYPAQDACKAVGGRLPNALELWSIYADRTSYGNNFQSSPQYVTYWSSTQSYTNSQWAYGMIFSNGDQGINDTVSKGSISIYTRCVKGDTSTTPVGSFNLTVNASAGGTVSGGGTFTSGSIKSMSATPNSGYWLKSWTGDDGCGGSYYSPRSIFMNSNKTCTANFVPNWIPGVVGTALEGKFVWYTWLGSSYIWGPDAGCPTGTGGSAPCQIGIDPNNVASAVLVSPQTYPAIDFSAYPAQNACKAIGGRLPNMQELTAIQADKLTYPKTAGGGWRLSATEANSLSAFGMNFQTGSTGNNGKSFSSTVQCVK